ncbi:hypothetical protein M758_12G073100 [Ceratodon purpureus]|nr:hypothetical protein M758_12G073100 [Ceratodon purpureus]
MFIRFTLFSLIVQSRISMSTLCVNCLSRPRSTRSDGNPERSFLTLQVRGREVGDPSVR